MTNSAYPVQLVSSEVSRSGSKLFVKLGHIQVQQDQGPVVQSLVSLTSSLRVILLTILTDSIYNILIFFAEKM